MQLKSSVIAVGLFLIIGIIACAAPVQVNTYEVKPVGKSDSPAAVAFTEIPPEAPIPITMGFVGLRLKRALEKAFYQKGGYGKGDDLQVEYMFMEIDPGDQFSRSQIMGAGQGKLKVDVVFKTGNGKKLGEIVVDCLVKSGDYDRGIEAVAKEIHKYTRLHFLK